MNPRVAITELRLRLNKLDSLDFDDIPLNIAVKAINKAAIEWFRRQIHGGNQYREGDEKSRMRMDDLQSFLTKKTLKGSNHRLYFESEEIPDNYLYFKRIQPRVTKGECQLKIFHSTLVEEANVSEYLADDNWSPSFDWEQCFHTLIGNKVRVYTNDDFKVNNLDLIYYRRPIKMDIEGYEHEDESLSVNVDLEFKDDIAHIIIDLAASILAGDIESPNQTQIPAQRAENNN